MTITLYPKWTIGLVGCVAIVLFVAKQQHHAAEQYKNHRAEYCSTFFRTPEQQKACVEERTNAGDYLPWWYELVRWPGGITTWAIILTGFAITWQSSETRKAASASAESARIAQNTSDVLRSKEKPRISVALDTPTPPSLQATDPRIGFVIKHKCAIPAYIKSATAGAQARVPHNSIRPSKLYSFSSLISQTLEGDGATITIQVPISGEANDSVFAKTAFDRLMAGEVNLVITVAIVFEDAYGPREYAICQILTSSRNASTPTLLWSPGPEQWQKDS